MLRCLFLLMAPLFLFAEAAKPVSLLLDWMPNPNHVVLYAGIEKGIFKKHGIDLTLKKLSDTADTIPYLTSGLADLAIYYSAHTLRSVAKGADVQIAGILIKEPLDALVFRADSGIKKLADLSGKVIGSATGSVSSAYAKSLEERGIKVKEFKKLTFDLVAALATRLVDCSFGCSYNIEPEQLNAQGIETRYFKISEFGIPDYYELIILSGITPVVKESSFPEKFHKAMTESIAFAKESPDEAFKLYAKANPNKDEKTLLWEKKAWNTTLSLLPKEQKVDLEILKKYAEWLKKYQLLAPDFEVSAKLIR